jgi:hypothetical protein
MTATPTPASAAETTPKPGLVHTVRLYFMSLAAAVQLAAAKALAHTNQTRRALQLRGLRRGGELDADVDEQGNVITDNLAWIVFGVLAIVVIGGAISGLGTAVIDWVTKQLNLG